ncbi:hypothetical protein N9C96_01125 [bacterium]|nr:hypothetical protein [bacterium]
MNTLANNLNPRNWAVAAVIATIVLTIFMEGIARVVFGAPLKPAALICGIFGWEQDMMMVAEIIHYAIGLIAFPIGYIVLRSIVPSVPSFLLGLAYGLVLWLVAMAVIAPMAGVAAFLGGGQMMIGSLVAHLAYGVVLAFFVGRATDASAQPA